MSELKKSDTSFVNELLKVDPIENYRLAFEELKNRNAKKNIDVADNTSDQNNGDEVSFEDNFEYNKVKKAYCCVLL